MDRRSASLGIALILVGCGAAFNFEYGLRGQNSFLNPSPRGSVMDFFSNMFHQHTQNDHQHWPLLAQSPNRNQEVSHWGLYRRPLQQADYERHFYNFGPQNDACSEEETDYSSIDVSWQDSIFPENFSHGDEIVQPVACNDDEQGIRWKGSQPKLANVEIDEVLWGGGQSQWGPTTRGYEVEKSPKNTQNFNGLGNVQIHNCFPQAKTESSHSTGNEILVLVIKKDHVLGDARKLNATAVSIDEIIGAAFQSTDNTNDTEAINVSSNSAIDSQLTTPLPVYQTTKSYSSEVVSKTPKTLENSEIGIGSTGTSKFNPTEIPLSSTSVVTSNANLDTAVAQPMDAPTKISLIGKLNINPTVNTPPANSKLNPTKNPLSTTTFLVANEVDAISQSPENLENPGIAIVGTAAADNLILSPTQTPLSSTTNPALSPISSTGEENVQPVDTSTKINLLGKAEMPHDPNVNTRSSTVNLQSQNPRNDNHAIEDEVAPTKSSVQSPDLRSGTFLSEANQEVIVNYPSSTAEPIRNVSLVNSNPQTLGIHLRPEKKNSASVSNNFPLRPTPFIMNDSDSTLSHLDSNHSSDTTLSLGKTMDIEENSTARSDQQLSAIENDKSSVVKRPQVTSLHDTQKMSDAFKPEEDSRVGVRDKISPIVGSARPISLDTSTATQPKPAKHNAITEVKVDPHLKTASKIASSQTSLEPTSTGTKFNNTSPTVNKSLSVNENTLSDSADPQSITPTIVNALSPDGANSNAVNALRDAPQADQQAKRTQGETTAGFTAEMHPQLMTLNENPSIVVTQQSNTTNSKHINNPTVGASSIRSTEEGVLSDSANIQQKVFTIGSFVIENSKEQGAQNISISDIKPSLKASPLNDFTQTATKTTTSDKDAFARVSEITIVNDILSAVPEQISKELNSSPQSKVIPKSFENDAEKSVTRKNDPHPRTTTIMKDDLNSKDNSVLLKALAKSTDGPKPVFGTNADPRTKPETIVNDLSSVVSNANSPHQGNMVPTVTSNFSATSVHDSTPSTWNQMISVSTARPDSGKGNDSQLEELAILFKNSTTEKDSKPVASAKNMLKTSRTDYGVENDSQSNVLNYKPQFVTRTETHDSNITHDFDDVVSNLQSTNLIPNDNLYKNSESNSVNFSVSSTSSSLLDDTNTTRPQVSTSPHRNIHELGHAIRGLHELVNKLISTVNSTTSIIGHKVNNETKPEDISDIVNKFNDGNQLLGNARSATLNDTKSIVTASVIEDTTDVTQKYSTASDVANNFTSEEYINTETTTSFFTSVVNSQSKSLNSTQNEIFENKGHAEKNSIESSNSTAKVYSKSVKTDDIRKNSPEDANLVESMSSKIALTVEGAKIDKKASSVGKEETEYTINLGSDSPIIQSTVIGTDNEAITTDKADSIPSIQSIHSKQNFSQEADSGKDDISSQSSIRESVVTLSSDLSDTGTVMDTEAVMDAGTVMDTETVKLNDNPTPETYDASSFTSSFDSVPLSTEEPKKSLPEDRTYHKILRFISWMRGKKDTNGDEMGNGATRLTETAFDPFEEIVESSNNGVPVIDKDILPENLANWFLGFRSLENDDTSMANVSQSSENLDSSSEFTDLYHSFLEAAIHNVNNVSSIVNGSEPIGTPLSWWPSYREVDNAQNDTNTKDVSSMESEHMEAAIHKVNNALSTESDTTSKLSLWWSKIKEYTNMRRASPLTESMEAINSETSSRSVDLNQSFIVEEKNDTADLNTEKSQKMSGWSLSSWETQYPHQNSPFSSIVNDTQSDGVASNLTNSTYILSSTNGTSFDTKATVGDEASSNPGEFYQFSTANASKTLVNEGEDGTLEITFSQPKSEWLSLLAQLEGTRNASLSAVNKTQHEFEVNVITEKPQTYSHFHASDFEVWSGENV